MKIVFVIFLSLVVAMGAVASGNSEEAADDGMMKLGAIVQNSANESQAYWQKLFTKHAADYGFKCTQYDGKGDATVQSAAVRDCIAQEMDAILICTCDQAAVTPALTEAVSAGVVVGLLNATITPMGKENYTFYVGVDDVLAGQAAGKAFIEHFPNGAKIVEIGGGAGSSPALNRHDGFAQGIAGSNIEVIEYQACSDWIANEAMGIMENMIVKYGDQIEGVFCHWDNGATTIIQALQAANMNDVYIIGVDGCRAGFDQVRDGTQAVTIMQNFDKMIPQAIEDAMKAVKGESFPNPDLVEWDVVTIDNIDDFLYPQW